MNTLNHKFIGYDFNRNMVTIMIHKLLASLSLLLFIGPNALGALVDFDDINATEGPIAITNQYQNQGVIFEGLQIIDVTSDPSPGPKSLPNAGVLANESPFSLVVSATFVDPSTGVSAVTDQIQATFFDTEVGTNLITLTAFDVFGGTIDSMSVTTPGTQFSNVELTGLGIHRIIMQTDADGALFDNFSFSDVTVVPIPGAALLFGSALIGVIGMRRKSSKTPAPPA